MYFDSPIIALRSLMLSYSAGMVFLEFQWKVPSVRPLT